MSEVDRLYEIAHQKLREAEQAWHAYFAACPNPSVRKQQAAIVWDRIVRAIRF